VKRKVFRVTHKKGGQYKWYVSAKKTMPRGYPTQAIAVAKAVGFARMIERAGGLAQVVLHGRNGLIMWERTYGKDPVRTKG
jgi:hypothetical protein